MGFLSSIPAFLKLVVQIKPLIFWIGKKWSEYQEKKKAKKLHKENKNDKEKIDSFFGDSK